MSPVAGRPDVPEPILHVDMDAFYASVEARDNPDLRGVPIAVGGGGTRGVVMAASYEARAYGVRSAMPAVRARRLCPDLVFVQPDFERYSAESKCIVAIFHSFTPVVEQISLDEAFLDVRGSIRLFGDPASIGEQIRAKVRAERDLPCSVGVAPNKMLAKLASAHAKPDGLVHVRAGEVRAFLDPLPVDRLWGVGPKGAEMLGRLGVRTIAELSTLPEEVLARAVGHGPAAGLAAMAAGRDDRAVVPHEAPKQVSAEQTYDRDLDAPQEIRRELLRLADRVSTRLRRSGLSARTVTIKVRSSTFKTETRAKTLDEPTDVAARIYRTAAESFERMRIVRPRIRLLGVAASGLVEGQGPEQLRLGEAPDRWRDADRAIDRVRERFGGEALERAATVRRRPRKNVPGPKGERDDGTESPKGAPKGRKP